MLELGNKPRRKAVVASASKNDKKVGRANNNHLMVGCDDNKKTLGRSNKKTGGRTNRIPSRKGGITTPIPSRKRKGGTTTPISSCKKAPKPGSRNSERQNKGALVMTNGLLRSKRLRNLKANKNA